MEAENVPLTGKKYKLLLILSQESQSIIFGLCLDNFNTGTKETGGNRNAVPSEMRGKSWSQFRSLFCGYDHLR